MVNKKLGKGLSSLLGNRNTITQQKDTENNGLLLVPIEKIFRDETQPRKEFDKDKIDELAQSIKKNGLIQPIILVKRNDNNFMIVAGERRWRAAKIAGFKTIDVIISHKSEKLSSFSAVIENVQREDLNSVEEAEAYNSLINEYNKRTHHLCILFSKIYTNV